MTLRTTCTPWMALALCLLGARAGAEDFAESVPAEPGGLLRVEIDGGALEIESHDRHEVRADAEADGFGRDADFELRAEHDGVRFRAKASGFLAGLGDLDARVRLRVPRTFSLEVHSGGGRVDVDDLVGDVEVHTSGGEVRAQRVRGSVALHTSGGRIEVDEIDGDVRARTSGGAIEVDQVTGAVDAETSGGALQLDEVGGPVRGRTSGGPIEVRFRGPPAGDLETSGGPIEVELAEGSGADLDAHTSGGRVEIDADGVFEGVRAPARVEGRLNGGGAPLRLRTSGGDIRIAVD